MRPGGAARLLLLAGLAANGYSFAPDASPVLENQGRPMSVPFHCSDEDIAWAGLSCSEQDQCPAYFELAAVEPVGDKIFAAGNIHSESVTLYSVFLGSDDGGKTWREAHERIRGAGLDHIQFIDFVNGWVSGEALSPLTQDPFLLMTTDGGSKWRPQPIFSDTEPGSIQQFWFKSKNEGSLVIDRGEGSEQERYALYESPDGGRSWNVKQLSRRPLQLVRPGETETDWRVRADRASQSFRIEHRQGERYAAIASFAVSAGACKPTATELTPPAEPAPELPAPAPTPAPRKGPRR